MMLSRGRLGPKSPAIPTQVKHFVFILSIVVFQEQTEQYEPIQSLMFIIDWPLNKFVEDCLSLSLLS
jgi:hypothetical protein